MADKNLALSTAAPPPSPAEADYDTLCQALMETRRGRWFLEEYARRNRHADTGLVLDAIGRIETTIREQHARHTNQGLRVELLEMARTIAQTRAVVADAQATPSGHAGEAAGDILAAAERLQDIAWTMREHGLDMAMCDQIADLSAAILSASSLRDPSNGRAHRLAEVLRTLEQRIDSMLDAVTAPGPVSALPATPSPVEASAEPPSDPPPAPPPDSGLDPAPAAPLPVAPLPVAAIVAEPREVAARPLDDPLAALKAMSNEERIALFT